MSSMAMMTLLQWLQPMNTRIRNELETFNEVSTLCFLYLLFCFSDWIEDPELSHHIGWVYIGAVITFGVVHVLIILFQIIRQLYRRIKHFYIRRQHKKQIVAKKTPP